MNRREVLMIVAGSVAAKAQTTQEFEVASIKPSAPMEMGRVRIGVEMTPGGRVSMTGVSVKFLIQEAYGVRDVQIVGGPGWIGSDRYDITAKPETSASGDQVKEMMKGLLASRFQLKFHRETKELPTYALVVAKGGSKLKKAEETDGPEDHKGGLMRMGRGHFTAQAVPMAAFANQLSQMLARSVIDKTELQGDYDIKMEWTPDESEGGMFRGGAEMHPEGPRPETTGPSLMTALQEQLGLKLESTKGPVEILTVDRVEKPSEN